jgi:NAD(P)H-hydrate epimerase
MADPQIDSHPILTLEEARAFEAGLFGGDERKEWAAMKRAGRAIAQAILRDSAEIGGFREDARLLVIAGKGNNAGDALIAARAILERLPRASADFRFVFGPRKLRSLAARAWRELSIACPGRVHSVGDKDVRAAYDLCIGGIFGYQFRPPLPAAALAAIAAADRSRIAFRAAVDLPSGLDEPGAYHADFTYATGSVKRPTLGSPNAGRLRYLDLGFFSESAGQGTLPNGPDRVILPSVLRPLAGLRPASSDKRSQGHLAIVGGSLRYPGSVLMATLAALRSGVGLVTSFVPAGLVAAFSARAPEAMWVGLPVTEDGDLALSGLERALAGLERASALAIGPGLGKSPETHALVKDLVSASAVPLVIDADGLQPDIVRSGTARRILTPHAGELERISGGLELGPLAASIAAVVLAKGPVTRVTAGVETYYSLHGGPVLSRGGSGDLLAGLAGGLLAQAPLDPLLAACRAAVWHGMAADSLARAHGQAAVATTQLLDFLGPALRDLAACPSS